MATPNQDNILYYSIPNGTLAPLLDANGQYIPASAFPGATPVNIIATLEPAAPPAAAATAAIASQPATTTTQPAPQQQQQPPACVVLFLQKDGSYALRPDSVFTPLSLGNFIVADAEIDSKRVRRMQSEIKQKA